MKTAAEMATVHLIASASDGNPEQLPECGGPLVIHATGEFECHGACVETQPASALHSHFHGPDALEPCDSRLARKVKLWGQCRRCLVSSVQ